MMLIDYDGTECFKDLDKLNFLKFYHFLNPILNIALVAAQGTLGTLAVPGKIF